MLQCAAKSSSLDKYHYFCTVQYLPLLLQILSPQLEFFFRSITSVPPLQAGLVVSTQY